MTIQELKNLATTIRDEVTERANTAYRVGQALIEMITNSEAHQKKVDQHIANAANVYYKGIINIATTAASSNVDTIAGTLKTGDLAFCIIGDAKATYPSTESRINVDTSLCKTLNYFFSTDPRGANVGDLLIISRQTYLLLTRTVCRIIPLNDAKPATNVFTGTEGIMTIWDKTQVNKIPGIETVANSALPKSALLPSLWTSNMNDALRTGVYPWCTLGRPAGSTGAYTCVVQRTSTNDGNYDTIDQTAYGREGELGQVYKRIIFYKSDGTDTQYGDWIRIDPVDYKGDLGNLSGTKCSEFISVLQERMKAVTGKTGRALTGRYTFSVRDTESKQELLYSFTGLGTSYTIRGSLNVKSLNDSEKTIDDVTMLHPTTVMCSAKYQIGGCAAGTWFDISLPVINDASTWIDYFLEDLEATIGDSLNQQLLPTGGVLEVGQYLAKKIKSLGPIDVAALMTEGGTLSAEAAGGNLSSLLTRPLYVKSDMYYSTVHVSVSNRVWYLVAHRVGYNTDGTMYRVQRIAECTAADNVMTCNKVTEFKE